MKITPKDYDTIKKYIKKAFEEATPVEFMRQYQQNGLSPKRLRWDLLRYADAWARRFEHRHLIGDNVGMPAMAPVYAYANDGHIDTALRQMMHEFDIPWAAEK